MGYHPGLLGSLTQIPVHGPGFPSKLSGRPGSRAEDSFSGSDSMCPPWPTAAAQGPEQEHPGQVCGKSLRDPSLRPYRRAGPAGSATQPEASVLVGPVKPAPTRTSKLESKRGRIWTLRFPSPLKRSGGIRNPHRSGRLPRPYSCSSPPVKSHGSGSWTTGPGGRPQVSRFAWPGPALLSSIPNRADVPVCPGSPEN